jgi:transposase
METKYQALLLLNSGKSLKFVARKFQINSITLERWKNQLSKSTLERKTGSGRKRLLNLEQEEIIEKIFHENRSFGSRRLISKVKKQLHLSLSARSIRRYRQNHDWKGVHPKTIPLLSKTNKKKRLEFAKIYENYSFHYVIFTDETTIELFRNTALQFKKKGEERPVKERGHFKISMMIWCGISWQGKTKVALIPDYYQNSKSKMNSGVYCQVLESTLLPFANKRYPDGWWYLLQDNAPIHKSKTTLEFFGEKLIKVIDFPPTSPDLNPIEKIWNELKRMVEERAPQSKVELKKSIKECWQKISLRQIRAHIKTLPKILRKAIEKEGEFVD